MFDPERTPKGTNFRVSLKFNSPSLCFLCTLNGGQLQKKNSIRSISLLGSRSSPKRPSHVRRDRAAAASRQVVPPLHLTGRALGPCGLLLACVLRAQLLAACSATVLRNAERGGGADSGEGGISPRGNDSRFRVHIRHIASAGLAPMCFPHA